MGGAGAPAPDPGVLYGLGNLATSWRSSHPWTDRPRGGGGGSATCRSNAGDTLPCELELAVDEAVKAPALIIVGVVVSWRKEMESCCA